MKRNGDEAEDTEWYRKQDNGIRNGNGRIIWTVGGNDLFRIELGGLFSWWDKTA